LAQSAKQLKKLQDRHKEVERHEEAHYREAGHLALSGPKLSDHVQGADGKMYATGGHVMINTSETGDPETDLAHGKIIVRSAEAPLSVDSDLSQADINVAAKGRRMIEKSKKKLDKLNKLKLAVGGMGSRLNNQQVKTLAKGLDLDMKPGHILNFLA
jgi:SprA family protein